MFRVLVLIGAILFFRAVLPRTPRWSSTAITPYMNALEGMMSAQQVSSVLDAVRPVNRRLASRRPKLYDEALDEPLPPESEERAISAARGGSTEILRP
jgi:hypothetical protein